MIASTQISQRSLFTRFLNLFCLSPPLADLFPQLPGTQAFMYHSMYPLKKGSFLAGDKETKNFNDVLTLTKRTSCNGVATTLQCGCTHRHLATHTHYDTCTSISCHSDSSLRSSIVRSDCCHFRLRLGDIMATPPVGRTRAR